MEQVCFLYHPTVKGERERNKDIALNQRKKNMKFEKLFVSALFKFN